VKSDLRAITANGGASVLACFCSLLTT
jgi:hypothetical protein